MLYLFGMIDIRLFCIFFVLGICLFEIVLGVGIRIVFRCFIVVLLCRIVGNKVGSFDFLRYFF